jgi:uncharacterized protein (TIRG00374 family)
VNAKTLRVAFSVVVSGIFLYFAVRGVDWNQALAALRSANYLWILPTFVITVWTLYIRAQRWRVFLHAVRVPPMKHLVAATNIGFMANMVLPARAGEVIRPWIVCRRENLPISGVLASVLLERIFDMFCVLLLFGVSATFVSVNDQVRGWGYMLTGLAVAVGLVIALLRFQEKLALGIAKRVCDLFPERIGSAVYGFIGGFVQALSMLDSPASFLRAFGWSIYLWLAIATIYPFGLLAFHLDVPLVLGSLVLTAIIAIAVSVPSAPGYIGSFQLGCVAALQIFGVQKDAALAFSLIIHLTQFIGVIAAGLYSLWTENMTFSQMEAVGESDVSTA